MPREGQARKVPSRKDLTQLLGEHGSIRKVAKHLGVSHTLAAQWYQRRGVNPNTFRPKITEREFRLELRAAGVRFNRAAAARGFSVGQYRRILRRSGIDAARQRAIMTQEHRDAVLKEVRAFEARAGLGPTNSTILYIANRGLLGRVLRSFGSWTAFDAWRHKGPSP